jgi:pimeloyl-ACP methyl ester carboxylesterase
MLTLQTIETVRSKDGTSIAYNRSGIGPALILVHGTAGSYIRWASILPALEPHFSVYALNRRGRGESGDAETYAIEREFEDVAALVEAIEEPVYLLGHSYGAICALEAARLTSNIHKLVLYEAPILGPGITMYPEGLIDRLEELLAAGKREDLLMTFIRELLRMPASEQALFRASPFWPARVAAAHTLPRELRSHEQYRPEPDRFKTLTVPTLLMVGGDSPSFFKAPIETLSRTLPNNQVAVLPGQQHVAMDTAPELFTREVLAFLSEPS